jgi:CRP-like cAMP-binding protein
MATAQVLPYNILNQHLFGSLKPEQRETIRSTAMVAAFQDGEIIYNKGTQATYLYVVVTGEVALRLPGAGGVSILVEQLGQNEIFGLNATFDLGSYSVTAQAVGATKIVKIETAVLKQIMESDLEVGYIMQKRISELYYKRYVATAQRLQAIVTAINLQAARPRQSDWLKD